MNRTLFFLIPFSIALAGCGRSPKVLAGAPMQNTSVSVVAAAQQQWPSAYEAAGTVRARASTVVSAKWMGYVREIHVNVGDRVREGQLLVALEARDLDAGSGRAEAAREEVRNGIPEADNAVASARSNLDLVQATFRRMKDLYGKKSISDQEFDEVTARLKSAELSLEMARARRTQLDSKLAQADQELRTAEVARSYASMQAPFAGIITDKSVDLGALAVPGAPLLTIERETYRLEASVGESKLGLIRTGQAVSVTLDGIERTFVSRVSAIVPSVDPSARAYTVKIDLPGGAALRSGMFGRAVFPLGSREALTIPAAAVIGRGQLESVFVADGGAARTRLITLGGRTGDKVEVLSGLNAGEQVIFPVPQGLADGARIEVRP
jgi:membrane fusion protein, multidrug efflux system